MKWKTRRTYTWFYNIHDEAIDLIFLMYRYQRKMAVYESVKETIVGTLYVIFLWAARVASSSSSSSMGSRRGSNDCCDNGSGLSLAVGSEGENARSARRRIVHSCRRKSSPSRSFFALLPSETSSSWTSSATGDLIGTESGVHMVSGEGPAPWENPQQSTRRQSSLAKTGEKKRDIPPPITLLQGRGDYTGPLPWFLTREYVDGRLILREANVQYFEYLQATRADGRFRIDLVAVDNTANCCRAIAEEDGEGIDEDEKEPFPTGSRNEKASGNNAADEEKALLVLDDVNQYGMPISFSASLPETTMEKELRSVEALRKCLTYTEGLASRNFLDRYTSHSTSPQLL